MSTAIKTELRTLFSSKIILLMLAFLFAASLFYYWNSLSAAHDNILYYQDELKGLLQYSAEIGAKTADSSSILDSLKNIFIVFHPKMVINTSLAIFLGMGMLVFPLTSSFFMGMEYGQRKNIKQKVASSGSLIKVVCAKAIILTLSLCAAQCCCFFDEWRSFCETGGSLPFYDGWRRAFEDAVGTFSASCIFGSGTCAFGNHVSPPA